MNSLRRAWETQHGNGSVVGLAPSEVAAQVLADELGIAPELIDVHRFVSEWEKTEQQAEEAVTSDALARSPPNFVAPRPTTTQLRQPDPHRRAPQQRGTGWSL